VTGINEKIGRKKSKKKTNRFAFPAVKQSQIVSISGFKGGGKKSSFGRKASVKRREGGKEAERRRKEEGKKVEGRKGNVPAR